MGGLIVWLIILLCILANIAKSQKKSGEEAKNQLKKSQQMLQKSQNYKRTVNSKQPVKQNNVPKQKPDILVKASANVAEDFEEKRVSQTATREEEIKSPYKPSEMKGQTESEIVQQESELMRTVNDLMAKGVDTELPFQRDFVAEGLDMINNMTL